MRGDTIWLDLKYSGEIINTFEDNTAWKGIDESKILSIFSWFFDTVTDDVKKLKHMSTKEVIAKLEEKELCRESYRFGSFGLDWKVRLGEGKSKHYAKYYVTVRDEIDNLLVSKKLQEAAYSLIDKKVADETSRIRLKHAIDESYFNGRTTLSHIRDDKQSADSLISGLSWQIVTTIITIIGMVTFFYFGFQHLLKRN